MPLSGCSASALRVRLDRAHGEAELAQTILDESLRRLLVPEEAGNADELLEEGDRVGEATLDGATGPDGLQSRRHGCQPYARVIDAAVSADYALERRRATL